MIRINLLPHRLVQQHADTLIRRQHLFWVLVTTLLLGLAIGLGLWLRLHQQQQHNQALHTLIQTHQPQAEAAQALAAQLNQLTMRHQSLARHLAQQTHAWQLLTQLQTLMPNSLYFTQVVWHQPLLSLEGQAGSHEAIALLVAQLTQLDWLQHVTLVSSQQQPDHWTFTLHAQTHLAEAP